MTLSTQQVLTTLGWIILVIFISPMVWLIFQPYFKGWSSAERRAASLLRDMLTAERVYRVPRTRGYVQVIENGHAVMRLCLQPVESLPDADVVVLHKLMIEANEEYYLQKANKYLCVD